MEPGSLSSGSADGGSAPPPLLRPPDRFFSLEDVLEQEITDLDYPWNTPAIEGKIAEYSAFSESINAQLSARVMKNYGEFVQGMQQVQSVETELTLIGVLIKNSRRGLQKRDLGLVKGSMGVARKHKKAENLKRLLAVLGDFQGVAQINAKLRHCLASENYCEAIVQHAALREALAKDEVRQFPGLAGLRQGLGMTLTVIQQKLSDGLKIAAVSTDFDAERYEEILKAFSAMSADQGVSVGKELLRHVNECIVAVSRQCTLLFSPVPANENPSDWHRKAQLRDLCRSMQPEHFVACCAQLYEHLTDFLYRHQFLCAWHAARGKAGNEGDEDASFRDIVREVLTELSASKRNVWDRIQQQVSLVLMTLEFQYPALAEDSFLHVLHLTQLLIEEGDAFMADFQPPRSQGAMGAEGRRQWSAPIRNTLKSKAHDYFQSLHFNAWVEFKVAHLEHDQWQRLPVARSYRLIRTERLQPRLPRPGGEHHRVPPSLEASLPKLRTAESNPFRNYKPESLLPSAGEDGGDGHGPDSQSHREAPDEIDEHALLQHWIEDSAALSMESLRAAGGGSTMLSNSNRSPVVASSTVELSRLLERYFRMMGALPQLATGVFESAMQLVEFYTYSVLCLFAQDRHVKLLLEDLESSPLPQGDPAKLYQRHESFLWQRLCPDLRRHTLRLRDSMSSLVIPDGCGASLNMQGPITVGVLLQVAPFPKLSSPSSLCGLAERCVGVESVCALLSDLRGVQQWVSALLPRGSAQEAVERSFAAQEAIAGQLRHFVLMCTARDVLEMPDVGRVSLDHFSSTVQNLRWEAKDFAQGSPAGPYMEQLRGQVEELARRIPCAGGGSIPHATQRLLWRWVEARVIQECAEVISKVGRKKSREALTVLNDDFLAFRNALKANFRPAEGSEEESLLGSDHILSATVTWAYLDHYVEAHNTSPGEALVWCKSNPWYPMRLHKALLEYVDGSNQKALKQHLGDLESYFAAYIADECTPTSGI